MNYYNDNYPKSCAWLAELIAAGEIPDGVVESSDGMKLLTFNCIVRSSHGPALIHVRLAFDGHAARDWFLCHGCAQSLERIVRDFNSARLTQFITEELERP